MSIFQKGCRKCDNPVMRHDLTLLLLRHQSLCSACAWSERLDPASPQTEATAIGRLSAPALTLDTLSSRLRDENTALTTTGSTWIGVNGAAPPTIGTGHGRIAYPRLAHLHF